MPRNIVLRLKMVCLIPTLSLNDWMTFRLDYRGLSVWAVEFSYYFVIYDDKQGIWIENRTFNFGKELKLTSYLL